MKKTFLVVVGFFMSLVLPAVSFSATPRPYVSGQLGTSFLTDSDTSNSYGTAKFEYDPGFATSVAGGVNFGMFRLEGEIGSQINEIDRISACTGGKCTSTSYVDGDVTAFSIMGNVYFDFLNKTPFTPFITAGLGVATVEVHDVVVDGFWIGDADDTVFAYQFGVGVAYAINKNMAIDLKYRYFRTADFQVGYTEYDYASNNIYVGFRFTF